MRYDCNKQYTILYNNNMKEIRDEYDCNKQYTILYNNNMKEIRDEIRL